MRTIMIVGKIVWLFVLVALFHIQVTTSTNTATLSIYDTNVKKEIESNLLKLFGFSSRPKVDRSKVVIPNALMDIYNEMMATASQSVHFPKRGLYTQSANTVRSFTHEESKIDERFKHHNNRFRFYFDMTNIPAGEAIKAAELKISKRLSKNVKHKVLAYDIIRPGVKGKIDPIFLLIDTVTISHKSNITVISIDALPAVQRWIRKPKENYGVLIMIKVNKMKTNDNNHVIYINNSNIMNDINDNSINSNYDNNDKYSNNNNKQSLNNFYYNIVGNSKNNKSISNSNSNNNNSNNSNSSNSSNINNNAFTSHHPHHIRLKRNVHDKEENWDQHQPVLLTFTDDGRHNHHHHKHNSNAKRERRASTRKQHRRKDGREMCQRRSLYVDFSAVGWSDWIVAPPGYDAYYCHGECTFPIPDHLNSTNHAVVQTLVNSINPSMAPRACCVPTQLNPISMLYLDDKNKVVLKNYQDMAVVGCGCR